ncbi:DUF6248 family natural product biosynthesis protein [Planomonospora sp. ID82291]|uniref:DUF6248 family natural product biosynthesis protein n=1 Tax=Planomonospora sp. ID82291 TaxID=2738136 RepID=UPI0018C3AF2C|nr:DUF6248 family natural product biosynthesis protein [Planomonospora sp. ID82291]MBG0818893.1 hypothetical protein [Planomonospora sp. ID82291]
MRTNAERLEPATRLPAAALPGGRYLMPLDVAAAIAEQVLPRGVASLITRHLCPCQWGPCGACHPEKGEARHHACLTRRDRQEGRPVRSSGGAGSFTTRHGYPLAELDHADRICRWECPCGCWQDGKRYSPYIPGRPRTPAPPSAPTPKAAPAPRKRPRPRRRRPAPVHEGQTSL